MTEKSPLQKIQETVVETVRGVVSDPAGAAAKAAEQARGVLALGRMVAEQVTKAATDKVAGLAGARPEPPRPRPVETPAAAPEQHAEVTPIDVARVVAKKAPPPRKAPAKKAPPAKAAAKKTTPSGRLPAKKTAPAATGAQPPAAKTPAKATAAKKAPAKKTPAQESPAKKAAVKKAPVKKTAVKKAPAKRPPSEG